MIAFNITSEIPLSCIEDLTSTSCRTLRIEFDSLGLIPRKSVVISPDSQSMELIEPSFFLEIYHRLENIGYRALINSDKNYWVDKGVRTCFPDPLRLLNYFALAGYSISSRSGVSDLFSFATEGKNIVIYTSDIQKTHPDFIFNKRKQNLCGKIDEYFYDKSRLGDIIEQIISSIMSTT
jgi:hypothetical protein